MQGVDAGYFLEKTLADGKGIAFAFINIGDDFIQVGYPADFLPDEIIEMKLHHPE